MVTGVPSEPRGSATASRRALVAIGVALGATAIVTFVSYAPVLRSYSDTLVGLTFLVITYFAVLRHDSEFVRRYGLSLGGLLEPEPVDMKRVARDALGALLWAFGIAVLVFPAFFIGWVRWWKPESGFSPAGFGVIRDGALPQLLAIALPEEAFYRGYLQSALDDAWAPRWNVLGARLGPAVLVTSALFALGHLATEFHPNRLGVFFPSLLFGWLRSRSRGIGACVVFHALCNVFADYIAKSYGFGG